jgi:hypothetical protein
MNTRNACLVLGIILTASLAIPTPRAEAESVMCVYAQQPRAFESLQPVISPDVLHDASATLREGAGSGSLLEPNDGLVFRKSPYSEFAYYDYQREENGYYLYDVTGVVDCNVQALVTKVMECLEDPIKPCDVLQLLNQEVDACLRGVHDTYCLLHDFFDWVLCKLQPFGTGCRRLPSEEWWK